MGINLIQALIFIAVFNGIASVPLLFMVAKVGNNSKIMGVYKNGLLSNIFVRIAFVVVTIAVLTLFFLYGDR